MDSGRKGGRPEAKRDLGENDFTEILRELWQIDPKILAVVFVDAEGECVDYCSSLSPYDAKVAGAHLCIVTDFIVQGMARVGHGSTREVVIHCEQRSMVVRRIDEEYTLVLILESGDLSRRILESVDRTARTLRRESVLSMPHWEPRRSLVHVETREGLSWDYAPRFFVERGQAVKIAAVLGRWEEDGQLCFRVATEDGRDLTLAHDAEEGVWTILRASRMT